MDAAVAVDADVTSLLYRGFVLPSLPFSPPPLSPYVAPMLPLPALRRAGVMVVGGDGDSSSKMKETKNKKRPHNSRICNYEGASPSNSSIVNLQSAAALGARWTHQLREDLHTRNFQPIPKGQRRPSYLSHLGRVGMRVILMGGAEHV